MKLTVDPEADALYLRLNDAEIVDSEQVASGVVLDYDANENVVGVELLHLSRRGGPVELEKLVFEHLPLPASRGKSGQGMGGEEMPTPQSAPAQPDLKNLWGEGKSLDTPGQPLSYPLDYFDGSKKRPARQPARRRQPGAFLVT